MSAFLSLTEQQKKALFASLSRRDVFTTKKWSRQTKMRARLPEYIIINITILEGMPANQRQQRAPQK